MNRLSLSVYNFFKILIYILLKIKKFYSYFIKILKYIFKIFSNRHIVLVSNDRAKYSNLNICNNYIKKKYQIFNFMK